MSTTVPKIPYYCQWESADAASRIIAKELSLVEDPLWRNSGATSQQEYAEWANHICGMACLKMILAARTGIVHPTIELAKCGLEFGAYVVREGTIHGMIYAPFVEMLKSRFGIAAEVVTDITAEDLPRIWAPGSLFLASVHPSIRWQRPPPPSRGGHLVLITNVLAENLTFHNPSGHDPRSQKNATLPLNLFAEFFAGRGVHVKPLQPNAA
jgi:hypothetical protein